MKKILIIEDEKSIREFIKKSFEISGCKALCAATGEEGLEIFKSQDDLDMVVLDIMLPGIDGFEVCKRMRSIDDTTGIIMLTAKSQENDKIDGLTYGADDYVIKPFSPKELIARADALYRKVSIMKSRNGKKKENIIRCGDIEISMDERTLLKDNSQISLTNTEFEVLALLASNPEKTMTRDQILDSIWGQSYVGSYKTVDVNILRIRKKLGSSSGEHIETVRGRGYRWKNF